MTEDFIGEYMSEITLIDAIHRINDEILDRNNGNTTAEDFYWWRAVLEIFGYSIDKDGHIEVSE